MKGTLARDVKGTRWKKKMSPLELVLFVCVHSGCMKRGIFKNKTNKKNDLAHVNLGSIYANYNRKRKVLNKSKQK